MERILVIDDEAQVRKIIARALRLKGFEPLEAESGKAGIDLARKHLPTLIISDINMDQGDGYTVLEALRQESATASIPFILMTGQANLEGRRRGMDQGADDYLEKPFTIEGLYRAVDARLRTRAAVKQAAERRLADLRANLSLMLPHELNTPLVAILGLGELIGSAADTLPPAQLAEMGQTIVAQGQRLQTLIQRFMLYAQVELLAADPANPSDPSEKGTVAVREVIAEAARIKGQKLGRSEDVVLELAETSVAMPADRFTRVLEEILDNAFKFSEAGTPVTVRCDTKAQSLQVIVADQGRGMSARQIEDVGAFMQFQRRFYEQQGAGLGLTIVKRLTELHGGKLRIDSEVGRGTTVAVTLPILAG